MERIEQTLEKLDGKLPENTREAYLTYLQQVLAKALLKFENRNTRNSEAIKWGRLIALCVSTGSAILKDLDLEDLSERVDRLEERHVDFNKLNEDDQKTLLRAEEVLHRHEREQEKHH